MRDSELIQAVKNTFAMMDIPATEKNVDRLYGIYQALTKIQDHLKRAEEGETQELTMDLDTAPEEVTQDV